MRLNKRYAIGCAVGTSLMAAFCIGGIAAADVPAASLNTPAARALMGTPAMQRAMALARKGDRRGALAILRGEAHQGNPMADVILGLMYFKGWIAPKNNVESVKWLKLALAKNQEPTRSMALDVVQHMSVELRQSAGSDKTAGLAASLMPFVAMLPRGAAGGRSRQGPEGDDDYFGHKLFDDMTDHKYDPYPAPGE